MRRIVIFVGCLLSIGSAAAETPLRCEYIKQMRSPTSAEVYIKCDVLGDRLRLDDISLNRGNCDVFAEDKRRLGSVLKFGDRLEIVTGSCNLLEYTITVNGTPLTFQR